MKICSPLFPEKDMRGFVFDIGDFTIIGKCFNKIVENPIIIERASYQFFLRKLDEATKLTSYYNLSYYSNKPIPAKPLPHLNWSGIIYFCQDVLDKFVHFGKPKYCEEGSVNILTTYAGKNDYSMLLSPLDIERLLSESPIDIFLLKDISVSFSVNDAVFFIDRNEYLYQINKDDNTVTFLIKDSALTECEAPEISNQWLLDDSASKVHHRDVLPFINNIYEDLL